MTKSDACRVSPPSRNGHERAEAQRRVASRLCGRFVRVALFLKPGERDPVRCIIDYLSLALFFALVPRRVIDPHVDNPRAIRAYEKAGFRKQRVLKEHEFHEGRWHDAWLMTIEREDWANQEEDAG